VTFVAGQGRDQVPTMGYVTRDACPGIGDDIVHVPGTSTMGLTKWS
jgi:hypothetical protein